MSNIRVNPSQYTTTQVVASIQISIVSMVFGESATFNVILFNETGGLIFCEQVKLIGEDYSAWGANDQYVVDYMMNKYGLSAASA